MVELSQTAQAALILHNAKKLVAGRFDGAWWILDAAMWSLVSSLPVGAEHSFVLAVIHSYTLRKMAA